MSRVLFALSMTSSQATMAFFSEDVKNVLAVAQWNNLGGTELAESLADKFSSLKAQVSGANIAKVFCVQGPGSFTGLRVSSAFSKGLATALNVPLVGIATFDMYGEAFAFSLRPTKAISLSLEECIENSYKFLEIDKLGSKVVEKPSAKIILGLVDQPLWPSLHELQRGVASSLERDTFHLDYGYTPEFKTL